MGPCHYFSTTKRTRTWTSFCVC